ncbi:Gfo/Idh/MocA family protein [Actinotalea sp. Marseille-Q4924]|uniref:Gfo/Idh/MocA family protein n=1 Tax=Actinotalea sp. Marseille-Q4924 TaxID=2866571 RepID=UPI001CE460E0|nr:Gfo/Idh/MocA family oxidoreductase [Actinotalea sp. Marseille-Q4924]
MTDLRVVVCGMGRWGNQWMDVLGHQPGVVLAGTAGGTVRSRPAGLRVTPGYRHHRDAASMLSTVEADVALITLPVGRHAEAIEQALSAGMSVLCEKPLVVDAEDLERVRAAAAAHPELAVVVGQNYRHRPWARRARDLITNGLVGTVGHLSLRFSRREFLEGGRNELRSPLLQDMSVHHLDLIRYLTGAEALEVHALEHRPPWSLFAGAPAVEVALQMSDGSLATYSGTWAGRGPETTWDGEVTVHGEHGTLQVRDGRFTLDGEPVDDVGPDGRLPQDDPEHSGDPDLHSVLRDFRRVVHDGAVAETGLRDNQHTIELLLAVQQAAWTGRPVALPGPAEIPEPSHG